MKDKLVRDWNRGEEGEKLAWDWTCELGHFINIGNNVINVGRGLFLLIVHLVASQRDACVRHGEVTLPISNIWQLANAQR